MATPKTAAPAPSDLVPIWRARAEGYRREAAAHPGDPTVARTNALRYDDVAGELAAALNAAPAPLAGGDRSASAEREGSPLALRVRDVGPGATIFTFAAAPPAGKLWSAAGQAAAARQVLRAAFLAAAEIAGRIDCALPGVRDGETSARGAAAHLELDWLAEDREAHRATAHEACEAVARSAAAPAPPTSGAQRAAEAATIPQTPGEALTYAATLRRQYPRPAIVDRLDDQQRRAWRLYHAASMAATALEGLASGLLDATAPDAARALEALAAELDAPQRAPGARKE